MNNLIFYPSYHKNQYIIKDIENFIKDNQIIDYDLFSYNKNSVEKQTNLYMCTKECSQLSVVLNFIKEYTLNNPNKEYNIYFFTDGYSENYENIDISDYITSNIIKFNYIVNKNKYVVGRLDYNIKWKNNLKFIYI